MSLEGNAFDIFVNIAWKSLEGPLYKPLGFLRMSEQKVFPV